MLGTDVVVTEPARFVDGELDDLLCARREADLAGRGTLAVVEETPVPATEVMQAAESLEEAIAEPADHITAG